MHLDDIPTDLVDGFLNVGIRAPAGPQRQSLICLIYMDNGIIGIAIRILLQTYDHRIGAKNGNSLIQHRQIWLYLPEG